MYLLLTIIVVTFLGLLFWRSWGDGWVSLLANSSDQTEEIRQKHAILRRAGIASRVRVEGGRTVGLAAAQIGDDAQGNRYHLEVRSSQTERAKQLLAESEYRY
jgi:hypothetical protein